MSSAQPASRVLQLLVDQCPGRLNELGQLELIELEELIPQDLCEEELETDLGLRGLASEIELGLDLDLGMRAHVSPRYRSLTNRLLPHYQNRM